MARIIPVRPPIVAPRPTISGVGFKNKRVGSGALIAPVSSLAGAGVTTAGGETLLNFHPGWWIGMHQVSSGFRYGPTQQAVESARIAELREIPEIVGVKFIKYWRYWEGPTQGDYGRMRQMMDYYLEQCAGGSARPIYLVMDLLPAVFAVTTSNIWPEYYLNSGDYEPTNNGYTADIWNAGTMDKLIALYDAVASEYGNEAYLEGLSTTETSISFGGAGTPASYSNAKLLTEFKRYCTEFRNSSDKLAFFCSANYLGTNAQAYELMTHCRDKKVVVGGPDTWGPQWVAALGGNGHRALQFDQLYRGESYNGTSFGTELVEELMWKAESQSPEIGGYMNNESAGRGPFTMPEQFAVADGLNHCRYFFIEYNTTYGTSAQKWSTGQLPFLQANPLTHTSNLYG
jgi:hypothetical protein